MFSIGLTGGIGSGKSRVADWLAEWGAAVIDTDRIAHELTAPGGGAIEPLRAAFGAGAIGVDGALDRGWMREHVFADPAARRRLETVLHPLIDQVVRDRADQARGCYRVFVVPLLVESGRWRDRVDRILDVSEAEARLFTRRLAKEEGVLAGMSSGGALSAAVKVPGELKEGVLVFIVCDRGDRYLSSDLFS